MSKFVPGQTKIKHYVFIKQIGAGAFASVWLAEHDTTKLRVAIKTISKSSITSKSSLTRFQREVSLLKNLNHPFISKFYEILEDSNYYFIVMEYVENGNMLDFINKYGRITESQARRYFSQILCVLEYLHKEKFIAHRDLKAENVLLDKYFNVRVIDFGLSNVFTKENPKLSTACGSPAYASPEMIKGQKYTKAADIWSAGVLLYSMVAGHLPFDDKNTNTLLQKIIYTECNFPNFMSPPLVDLLRKILKKNPDERIKLDKIKEHVWFSQSEYLSLLELQLKESTHTPISIDKEIVTKMNNLGMDTHSLYESLLRNEFNETTSIYHQYARQKMTEQMKDLMQKLQTNTSVQPSNQAKFSFNFNNNNQKTLRVSFANAATTHRRQSQPHTSIQSPEFAGMPKQAQVVIEINPMVNPNSPNPNINGNNNFPNISKVLSPPVFATAQQANSPMRVMQVPAPVQIAARRLSRPVAFKRTLDISSPRRNP